MPPPSTSATVKAPQGAQPVPLGFQTSAATVSRLLSDTALAGKKIRAFILCAFEEDGNAAFLDRLTNLHYYTYLQLADYSVIKLDMHRIKEGDSLGVLDVTNQAEFQGCEWVARDSLYYMEFPNKKTDGTVKQVLEVVNNDKEGLLKYTFHAGTNPCYWHFRLLSRLAAQGWFDTGKKGTEMEDLANSIEAANTKLRQRLKLVKENRTTVPVLTVFDPKLAEQRGDFV